MKRTSHNKSRQPKPTPVTKKKNRWWILGIIIIGATIGFIFWKNNTIQNTTNSTSTTSPINTSTNPDKDLLIGRWTRTDSEGAYVIEIKSANVDGKLNAGYFNPNPIKVGYAEWQNKNGKLVVVVELRDVNYPGSTYTLTFLSAENRLTGNYYQAVEGTNFDVEFVRAR